MLSHLEGLGKMLILVGLLLAGLGVAVLVFSKVGLPLKLPGDIIVEKRNFTFYFPIVSMLLLSAILTLVFSLILRR